MGVCLCKKHIKYSQTQRHVHVSDSLTTTVSQASPISSNKDCEPLAPSVS